MIKEIIQLLYSLHIIQAKPVTFWRDCEMLDLTHNIVNGEQAHALKLYKDNPPLMQPLVNGMIPNGEFDPFFVYFNKLTITEHEGTHIDAPKHVLADDKVAATARTVDQVSLTQIMGEACVVDVPETERNNQDYLITPNDLKDWERSNGPFHEDCIVVIRTGHEKFWGDRARYLGIPEGQDVYHTDEAGNPDLMHWQALSPESAQWLLDNRGLKGLAQDTVSVDAGQQFDWAHSVHSVLLGSDRIAFENVANLSKLPARGATIVGLPLKLQGGSGSPARMFAFGWTGPNDPCRYTHPTQNNEL